MPPRDKAFTFCIDSCSILISGGDCNKYLKDAFILDATQNTLRRINDLPEEDYFENPSTLMVANNIFAISISLIIFKFSIEKEEWGFVH